MGGAILLLEGAEEKRHDVLSSLYGASTIGGILLASLGVSVLCQVTTVESGWRVLYVIGGVTALFGCMIRVSQKVIIPHRARQPLVEIGKTLWAYRRPASLIAIGAGFSYANYSVAFVLINGLVLLVTSSTKEQMMQLNSALLILDFAMLPFCGWISSKISREQLMIGASLATLLSALPLFLILEQATWASVIGVRIFLVFLGVAFSAPLHAWAQSLIPEAHRYLVISFGYAMGSQLLGAPTAAISLWLFKETGMITSIAWYWMALAIVASLVIAKAHKMRARVFGGSL